MYLLWRNVCLDLLPTFVCFSGIELHMLYSLFLLPGLLVGHVCRDNWWCLPQLHVCRPLRTLHPSWACDDLSMAFPVWTPSNPGLHTVIPQLCICPPCCTPAQITCTPEGCFLLAWRLRMSSRTGNTAKSSSGLQLYLWASGLGRVPSQVCASLDTPSKPCDNPLELSLHLYGYA